MDKLSAYQIAEIGEASEVLVRTLEAMGLAAIVIVDGLGHSACMFSSTYEPQVSTLLASSYNSLKKRQAHKAN